jgi:hypothetical protein
VDARDVRWRHGAGRAALPRSAARPFWRRAPLTRPRRAAEQSGRCAHGSNPGDCVCRCAARRASMDRFHDGTAARGRAHGQRGGLCAWSRCEYSPPDDRAKGNRRSIARVGALAGGATRPHGLLTLGRAHFRNAVRTDGCSGVRREHSRLACRRSQRPACAEGAGGESSFAITLRWTDPRARW